jgi:uroporphyrinogen decarboxylase
MAATRAFSALQPKVWEGLLARLRQATVHFLRTLVDEGADVYQLFDSWGGMLGPEEYQQWAHQHHEAIFAAVREVPRILFVKECPYLDLMADSGADVISLGKRHDLAEARRLHPRLVFQGNVDEQLLVKGTAEQVAEATRSCVAAGGGFRHIVNLSHGVDRNTPVANFETFVQTARATAAFSR